MISLAADQSRTGTDQATAVRRDGDELPLLSLIDPPCIQVAPHLTPELHLNRKNATQSPSLQAGG